MQKVANRVSLEMNIHECHGFSAEWSADSINVKYLVNFVREKNIRGLFFSNRKS
jgi:hypothetical protein